MSERTIHRIVSGTWRQNGYVVEESGSLIAIDPGLDLRAFTELIDRSGSRILAIVNTHAHFDHIGSVAALVEAYAIPFYLHRGDAALLRQANLYRALFGEPEPVRVPTAFVDMAAGVLRVGPFDIEVIETPGHTKGGVCLRLGEALFTGDTLFGKGAGRTDLPGGSREEMEASQELLRRLPADLTVYPGHGKSLGMGEIRMRVEEGA